MTAQDRGWGPGWPHCQSANLVKVVCGGRGLRLPVRSEIAVLVADLVQRLEAERGRAFRADWSWGFACRAIKGTSTPSNHSWGLAIDLDAPENLHLSATAHKSPHQLRKRFPGGRVLRSTMPDATESIAESLGFRWGGVYRRPDPMHFEFMGSPSDALDRARRLKAGGGAGPGSPGPTRDHATRTYTVKSGDTLSEIGRDLGVDWHELAEDNKVPPPDYVIFPGQILWF